MAQTSNNICVLFITNVVMLHLANTGINYSFLIESALQGVKFGQNRGTGYVIATEI